MHQSILKKASTKYLAASVNLFFIIKILIGETLGQFSLGVRLKVGLKNLPGGDFAKSRSFRHRRNRHRRRRRRRAAFRQRPVNDQLDCYHEFEGCRNQSGQTGLSWPKTVLKLHFS